MNIAQLVNTRLITQQITGTSFTKPEQIVRWMGAMQAQDYAMAKWAIGCRLPGSTEKEIEGAIDKAAIIRTHVLRPTWHFVSAKDIHWILALTAPQVKTSAKSRHKQLELTDTSFRKANKLIQKILQGNNHMTREEIMLHFKKAKINISDERPAHFMFMAELDGIVCSGVSKAKKHTYALLSERVPEPEKFNRDKALATLAEKYFQSHGPATLEDFIWWSGLRIKDARNALEMIQPGLQKENIGAQTYWFDKNISFNKTYKKSVYALPAFDEFTISYKDRSAMMPVNKHKEVISVNGIFNPIIVVNGKVCGLWSRSVSKNKVIIKPVFFETPAKSVQTMAKKSFKAFAAFINKEADIDLKT